MRKSLTIATLDNLHCITLCEVIAHQQLTIGLFARQAPNVRMLYLGWFHGCSTLSLDALRLNVNHLDRLRLGAKHGDPDGLLQLLRPDLASDVGDGLYVGR